MSIRIARISDAANIANIYAPSVDDSATSFETVAPDAAEMARRIEALLKTHPWLVWDSDGEAIAYAYAGPHRGRGAYCWSCEVSIYVGPKARRQGVARKLYLTLFEILKQQGLTVAYSGITLPNAASVGLHESLGFEPVGIYRNIGYKAGSWHDVGWWDYAIQPPSDQPSEPEPFASMRKRLLLD